MSYQDVETILDLIGTILHLTAGGILMYMLFQFSEGLSAWVELDKMVNGW